jgi:hypothetical protein
VVLVKNYVEPESPLVDESQQGQMYLSIRASRANAPMGSIRVEWFHAENIILWSSLSRELGQLSASSLDRGGGMETTCPGLMYKA